MRSISRILVAIKDPAARSQPALMKAAQLARGLGAKLELFHAMDWPLYASPYLNSDSGQGLLDLKAKLEEAVMQRLTALARSIASRGRQRALSLSIATEWDAPAYEAVIRRALSSKAGLIVAEPHHGHRLLPILHFNDWELLRRSPIPVLLVKRRGLYARPAVLAAVDPTHRADPAAQLDRTILHYGDILAQALKGQLHSVHAYAAVPPRMGRADVYALDLETAAELNHELALAAQNRFSAVLRDASVPERRRHLLAMSAPDAIEQTARSTHAAIVTLGVVARSGWRQLLIGRTAERLLDRLPCDLLVVKPPHFRVAIARQPRGLRLIAAPLSP